MYLSFNYIYKEFVNNLCGGKSVGIIQQKLKFEPQDARGAKKIVVKFFNFLICVQNNCIMF